LPATFALQHWSGQAVNLHHDGEGRAAAISQQASLKTKLCTASPLNAVLLHTISNEILVGGNPTTPSVVHILQEELLIGILLDMRIYSLSLCNGWR
jgi:hypothetical protein